MRTASKSIQVSKPRRLTKSEVELLKRTVAKGVSEDEFALFLWVCKKHKVDPLTRQIHCVRRWLQKHHQDEKSIWVGGYQMTIQMGIDGYRSLAGRDHPDYGGCDEPEFEFAGTEKRIPSVARIRLWKKGLEHPVVGVAYWDEYAPKDMEKPEAFFWKKMPKHMLAKCAEALALRKGYPELSDIYTNEEMSQAYDEHTSDGREIIDIPRNGSAEAAQAIAERKIDEAAERGSETAKKVQAKKTERPANPKPKEPPLLKQEGSAGLQEGLWPKGAVHSTERA